MAAFRRCVIALAVLAVFAGLASAQTPIAMQCTYNTFPNTIRGEAVTDQVGDITIVCTGGTAPASGGAIPQLNFSVQLGTTITNRLLLSASGISDALLMIDEPGTGPGIVAGFGPGQAATVCSTPTTGCSGFFVNQTAGGPVMSSSSTSAVATAPNVFQGIVSGNSVTFFGIPVLAPASAGTSRIFRITNVRVGPSTGNLSAGSTVSSSITFTSNSNVSVNSLLSLPSNSGTVSIVQKGLDPVNTKTSKTAAVATSAICTATTNVTINTISFVEGFGNAFKTRLVGTAAAGSAFNVSQVLPGNYNSESGVTIATLSNAVAGSAATQGGLADFGTRLKAVFTNIPTGVTLSVSTSNVVAGGLVPTVSAIGSNIATSFAQLISLAATEGSADAAISGTGQPTLATTSAAPQGAAPLYVSLTPTAGTATAIWEVFNQQPTSTDTMTFNVNITYAAGAPPVTGAAIPSVALGFAPDASSTSGATAMPKFASVGTATGLFTLTTCRTVLLYPFVTAGGGYDTGLVISNTSLDSNVFATQTQSGTCTLNYYAGGAATFTAATAPVTPVILPGQSLAFLADGAPIGGVTAPFQGYLIAACNFSYGHGFAYISNYGNGPNQSSAMGYVALVIPDVGAAGQRASTAAAPESLGN